MRAFSCHFCQRRKKNPPALFSNGCWWSRFASSLSLAVIFLQHKVLPISIAVIFLLFSYATAESSVFSCIFYSRCNACIWDLWDSRFCTNPNSINSVAIFMETFWKCSSTFANVDSILPIVSQMLADSWQFVFLQNDPALARPPSCRVEWERLKPSSRAALQKKDCPVSLPMWDVSVEMLRNPLTE